MTEQERLRKYVGEVISRALDDVRQTGSGGRNSSLNAASFTLGILVSIGILPADEAEEALMAATSGWDSDWDSGKKLRTIRGSLRDGAARGGRGAVLPPFARNWADIDICAALGGLGQFSQPEAGEVARFSHDLAERESELAGMAERMKAEVARVDLVRVARWALHGSGPLPRPIQGRELIMLHRLSGPKLEMAELMRRGIDLDIIGAADLGRVLWPALPSEKFPGRTLRERRSVLVPWYGVDGYTLEHVQFRHVDDGGHPKYHWLEELGAGVLYNAADLAKAAKNGQGVVVVEGALNALRVMSVPGFPHAVVALPSEASWRRAYSAYGHLFDELERLWIIPDAVPADSRSRAVIAADEFAEAVYCDARVVILDGEHDPDEWLNLAPGNGEGLITKLDQAYE